MPKLKNLIYGSFILLLLLIQQTIALQGSSVYANSTQIGVLEEMEKHYEIARLNKYISQNNQEVLNKYDIFLSNLKINYPICLNTSFEGSRQLILNFYLDRVPYIYNISKNNYHLQGEMIDLAQDGAINFELKLEEVMTEECKNSTLILEYFKEYREKKLMTTMALITPLPFLVIFIIVLMIRLTLFKPQKKESKSFLKWLRHKEFSFTLWALFFLYVSYSLTKSYSYYQYETLFLTFLSFLCFQFLSFWIYWKAHYSKSKLD